jgi:hypothetical protein
MGPVDWLAVILAANFAVGLGIVWNGPLFRTGKPLLGGRKADGSPQSRNWALVLAVFLIAAAMLGHNFARIGAETLAAKPWLYFMQAGGLAIAFVLPALWLTHARNNTPLRERLVDAGFWLTAYLAMGAVFWVLAGA